VSASIRIFALTLLAVASFVGRSTSLAPPPTPPPTITQATFEPVYRASKAIQGATGPGVTYVKFDELLQALSTEIAIAKDQQMNDLDRKLIALYEEALAAYKLSATTKAGDTIRRATEIYYGRSTGAADGTKK
jgi:hypothetical protein